MMLLALGFLVVTAAPAELETPWMSRGAPVIAEVRVLSVDGERGTMGTARVPAIRSIIRMEVLRPVRGDDGIVTIRQLGGVVGEEALHVSRAPVFRRGERYIVMLKPDEPSWPVIAALHVVDGRVFTMEGQPVVGINTRGLLLGRMGDACRTIPAPVSSSGTAKVLSAPCVTMDGVMRVEEALRVLSGTPR